MVKNLKYYLFGGYIFFSFKLKIVLYFILIEMLTGQDVESLEEFERYHHNFNMYDEKNYLTIIHY